MSEIKTWKEEGLTQTFTFVTSFLSLLPGRHFLETKETETVTANFVDKNLYSLRNKKPNLNFDNH